MMPIYKPKLDNPVPMKLLIPAYSSDYGVTKKTYPAAADGILFYGTF